MPDLLLELGCEELPASFVRKAYEDLAQAVSQRLQEAEIPFEPGNPPIGTPRRLIVHFASVAERQPDRTKEMRGPSVQAAYDAEGKPSKALEGFCRGQGVDPAEARKEGDYVWVTKTLPGQPTAEILKELLPEAIRSLSFEKSMKWGAARMRFARPIRWILASFGGQAVVFEIEDVRSGLQSRGHRFENPEPFEAKTFDELVDGLITRHVEPDPIERKKRIQEGSVILATGEPEISDALLDENVFLTEWPAPLEGKFREEYLELPEAVLVTAMAKHEKMFPVRGRDGRLVNRFVFVRNSGDESTVRAGAEWVLNARFNDAKFFFDEDKKHSLSEFLERTSGILFQEKLGTVRQRADRLAELAAEIARNTPVAKDTQDAEIELARQAGLYAKADLATGLVSELASLQGIVGGEYARREGFPEAVCQAVAGHYELSRNLSNDQVKNEAGARTAVRLLIADQLDKLVGYLGLGLAPSGSSDPFGLRRAATMLIEAASAWPGNMPSYESMLDASLKSYKGQFAKEDLRKALQEVFEARYESLLSKERPDLIEATKKWALSPQDAKRRLEVLKKLANDRDFVQTATRPINILAAAIQKGQYSEQANGWESALKSSDGTSLLKATREALENLKDGEAGHAAKTLKNLEAPINSFFESTMVMDEDPKIRAANLELVKTVSEALFYGGDFSKVVLEGT